jgi:hypothetical protein
MFGQGDRVTMECDFCDIDSDGMKKRIFYRDKNWFAILAAPFHNTVTPSWPPCVQATIAQRNPRYKYSTAYQRHYQTRLKRLRTFTCQRTFFLHLFEAPQAISIFTWYLYTKMTRRVWRNSQKDRERYKKGHLMEFLGHVEKQGDEQAEAVRRKSGLSEEQQRTRIVASQKPDIEKLRLVTGYYSR